MKYQFELHQQNISSMDSFYAKIRMGILMKLQNAHLNENL